MGERLLFRPKGSEMVQHILFPTNKTFEGMIRVYMLQLEASIPTLVCLSVGRSSNGVASEQDAVRSRTPIDVCWSTVYIYILEGVYMAEVK